MESRPTNGTGIRTARDDRYTKEARCFFTLTTTLLQMVNVNFSLHLSTIITSAKTMSGVPRVPGVPFPCPHRVQAFRSFPAVHSARHYRHVLHVLRFLPFPSSRIRCHHVPRLHHAHRPDHDRHIRPFHRGPRFRRARVRSELRYLRFLRYLPDGHRREPLCPRSRLSTCPCCPSWMSEARKGEVRRVGAWS